MILFQINRLREGRGIDELSNEELLEDLRDEMRLKADMEHDRKNIEENNFRSEFKKDFENLSYERKEIWKNFNKVSRNEKIKKDINNEIMDSDEDFIDETEFYDSDFYD